MGTTKKKKKCTVLAAGAILSATGFAVAQYNTSYSGDNGDGGRGGGIRASVDTVNTVDGLLLSSSVDLRSGWSGDETCIPATGTWGGKSIQSGDSPFETCYQNKNTGEECWSKSNFNGYIWLQCYPY